MYSDYNFINKGCIVVTIGVVTYPYFGIPVLRFRLQFTYVVLTGQIFSSRSFSCIGDIQRFLDRYFKVQIESFFMRDHRTFLNMTFYKSKSTENLPAVNGSLSWSYIDIFYILKQCFVLNKYICVCIHKRLRIYIYICVY